MLPCPMTKINGKLQQPNTGRMIKGTDSFGKKVCITAPEIEVLAEGGETAE